MAPDGVIGVETILPLTLTELVKTGVLTLEQAIIKLTSAPARILGLDKGTLEIGADADVTIIDAGKRWKIDRFKLHSNRITARSTDARSSARRLPRSSAAKLWLTRESSARLSAVISARMIHRENEFFNSQLFIFAFEFLHILGV